MTENAIVYVVCACLIIAAGVLYVMGALGQKSMLKTLGYMHPGYAWIPILNIYTIGWISGQYDNKRGPGREGRRLVILLVSAVAVTVLSAIFLPNVLRSAGSVTKGMIVVSMLAISVICHALCLVFYYASLYKLFLIFDHDNAVIFMLLSLLFSVQYIIIFALKDKKPMYLRVSSPNYQTEWK